MSRYATELHDAFMRMPEVAPSVALEHPHPTRLMARVSTDPWAHRLDRAWFRYVGYPRSLRRRPARLFHILDHGYAHLIRALDADRTVVTCHDVIPLLAAEGVIPLHVSATV